MVKRSSIVVAFAVLFAGNAWAQDFPLMNMIADRVIEKYRPAQLLRDDPQMRTAFINKVAAPIVNKMFDCGLLP